MSPSRVTSALDYALLRPDATAADVDQACLEAVEAGVRAVCVNPVHIKLASWLLKNEAPIPICCVGSPLGATLSEIKAKEAFTCVELGAREVKMPMNLAAFKAGDYAAVVRDIQTVVAAVEVPVTVIVEVNLVKAARLPLACSLCQDGGAQGIMAGSGFAPYKSSATTVRILRQASGDTLRVVAIGNGSTIDSAMTMMEAGADRICSSTIPVMLNHAC